MDAYEIRIEAEDWEPGAWNPADDNTEVNVTFADGTHWEATFFTYANIATLVEQCRQTGANLSGRYFWARDMILIEEINRELIEEVIARLLETGDFYEIFNCCDEADVC
jgi:hypothetical protein